MAALSASNDRFWKVAIGSNGVETECRAARVSRRAPSGRNRPRPDLRLPNLPTAKPPFDPEVDECPLNFVKDGDHLPT